MTAAKQRIYVVGDDERLVRAANVVQARNHVAKLTIKARLASQEDLMRLAKTHDVEQAVQDVATEPMPLGDPTAS